METFAEYLLSEKDLISKMDILYRLQKMLKERKTMSRVDIRKHFGLSEDKFATFLATATFLIPIYEDEKHNIGLMEEYC